MIARIRRALQVSSALILALFATSFLPVATAQAATNQENQTAEIAQTTTTETARPIDTNNQTPTQDNTNTEPVTNDSDATKVEAAPQVQNLNLPRCVSTADARYVHLLDPVHGTATVTQVNLLPLCPGQSQPVSLASYEKSNSGGFEDSLPQFLFSHDSAVITPQQRTVVLHATPPTCYYQIDLFFGSANDVLPQIVNGGDRYYNTLLGHTLSPGNQSTGLPSLAAVHGGDTACAPRQLPPRVSVSTVPCTQVPNISQQAIATVTNTDDISNLSSTYSVTFAGQTKNITLADGASGTVTFSGVSPGTYSAVVAGSDGTATSNSITVHACPVMQPKVAISTMPCTASSGQSDSVVIKVTNPTDNGQSVTYTVTIDSQTQTVTVPEAASQSLTFYNLPAGNYKATVTGSDGTSTKTNEIDVNECPLPPKPVTPTATTAIEACVVGSSNRTVTVNVTNTADATHADAQYVVTLGNASITLNLADGATGMANFANVAAGSHTVTFTTNDGTAIASQTVQVEACPAPPALDLCPALPGVQSNLQLCLPGQGGGQVLGASTTTSSPSSNGVVGTVSTPTELPSTGPTSLMGVLITLFASALTYMGALGYQRRQTSLGTGK